MGFDLLIWVYLIIIFPDFSRILNEILNLSQRGVRASETPLDPSLVMWSLMLEFDEAVATSELCHPYLT